MINLLKIIIFLAVSALAVYFSGSKDSTIFIGQAPVLTLMTVFLSGFFYTSFLTAPLSVVLLISLASSMNPYLLAATAGLGAVAGDLFIVKIFRTIFSAFSFVRHRDFFKAVKKQLKSYHLDIISIILGSVIVASPLPDELGLILLGVSKLSYFKLALLTFLLNSLGILIIVMMVGAI